MTIEFHCPHCEKVLKTADDKAGVQARCPGCGETVTVPVPDHPQAEFDAAFGAPGGVHRARDDDAAEDYDDAASGVATTDGDTKSCPMCGAQIKKAAVRCRFCGEDLSEGGPSAGPGEIVPTRIDAGDVLRRSWAIFKAQLGMCLAIVLLMYAVNLAVSFGVGMVGGVVQIAARDVPALAMGSVVMVQLLSNAVSLFLQLGTVIALLHLARGESAQIGDLFSGGRYFLRGIGAAILVGLGLVALVGIFAIPGAILGFGFKNNGPGPIVGLAFAVVGGGLGLYAALRLTPFLYYLVDRNAGVVESLQGAWSITANNVLSLIVLGFASVGVVLLGMLACLVGLLFAIPLVFLIQAVTYCAMTGQRTA